MSTKPTIEVATLALAGLFVYFLFSTGLYAQGIAAGTVIRNVAVVTFHPSDAQDTVVEISTSNEFVISETINVDVTWLDSPAVVTSTPGIAKVLSFRVTNTGNGNEAYSLKTNDMLSGDDFNPQVQKIYLESNGIPGFQNNADTLYIPGNNDPLLAADESIVVYVSSDIPANLGSENIGKAELVATSTTQGARSATRGTALANAGDNGIEAVLLVDYGTDMSRGHYIVSTLKVDIQKRVISTIDRFGNTRLMPGSKVTYEISVNTSGDGIAENVVIRDPTPANMQYVANSIFLDGTRMTDATDTDAADFNISNTNTASITLGNLTTSASHVIQLTYQVE
jgi:uncharacterized repeat protein (TIGR01451 family)